MLESQESVQLLYSSSFTCFILDVRACSSKQSPFSQCGGNSWQSRESLGNRSQPSPASKLSICWLENTDGPSGPSIWIWGIRRNAEYDKGCGSKKGNHSQKIPPHMASFYLLQWPIRGFCFILCFQPLWSEKRGAAGKYFSKGCGKVCSAQPTWKKTRGVRIFCWKASLTRTSRSLKCCQCYLDIKDYKEVLF